MYDECVRRYWHGKAENFIDFNILEEAETPVKPVLESAESMLRQLGGGSESTSSKGTYGSLQPVAPQALADEARAEHERRKAVRTSEQMVEKQKAQQGRQAEMAAAAQGQPQPPGVSNTAWKAAVFQHGQVQRPGPYHDKGTAGKGGKGGKENQKFHGYGKSGAWNTR